MIAFAHLRTKRVSVQMRELTLGEAEGICGIPGRMHEQVCTQFLRYVASGATQPTPSFVTDPVLWTVEERMRVVTQYLSQVADDGPDFSIGNQNFSTYVDLAADNYQAQIDLGDVGGKALVIRPLLGVHAQLLERVCEKRGDWIIGAMACQVQERGEEASAAQLAVMDDVSSLAWIKDRTAAFKAMPESDAERVHIAYMNRPELVQFFRLDFDNEGVICLPVDDKEAGADPARFRAISCLSRTARSLFG